MLLSNLVSLSSKQPPPSTKVFQAMPSFDVNYMQTCHVTWICFHSSLPHYSQWNCHRLATRLLSKSSKHTTFNTFTCCNVARLCKSDEPNIDYATEVNRYITRKMGWSSLLSTFNILAASLFFCVLPSFVSWRKRLCRFPSSLKCQL